MGFFDKKPKNDGGLFGSKYEPDAWRKNIPYNDTHDSHIWDQGASVNDGYDYPDGSKRELKEAVAGNENYVRESK